MSIVQEIMHKSTDYLRRIIAPVGGQGGVTMSELQPFPFGRLRLVGHCQKEVHQLVVCDLWKEYDWKQPNRLLVVQTGESVEQAKVFKAHAIP